MDGETSINLTEPQYKSIFLLFIHLLFQWETEEQKNANEK